MDTGLDRELILRALRRLSELLKAEGVQGEICLLGGSVMVLAFKARASTKDVDAVFHPAAVIRRLAQSVQRELDLPENWLNDGAKGFVSDKQEIVTGDLPQFENLRVAVPTAEYLLAMKCIASRIAVHEGGPSDIQDIKFLIKHLRLKALDEAMAIVSRYYPQAQIPTRARFVLEDIFSEREGNQ